MLDKKSKIIYDMKRGEIVKENFFKYIFVLVIIVLVGYCIYTVYKENNKPKEVEIVEQEINPTILSDLRLAISNFDTLNPILSNNQNVQDISRLIYEPLVNITNDYKIELCLAKEYTKINNTTYLIKIRDDVLWQDGKKLTAEDVRFTIDRLKDSPTIYSLNVARVSEVEVIDDTTLRINLFEEVPFFEYNLIFPIMSNSYYLGEDFVNTAKNNTPVGTGKYKISEVTDKKIVLKQNQNWWNINNEECKIDTITLNLYNSMGEVYNDFKLGSLDLITTNSLNYQDYIGTIGYNKKEYKQRQYDFIALNCTSNLLAKKEVRQAISYAIDRNNINSAIYQNQYYVTNFPLDYGSYLYNAEGIETIYDPNKASQVLEEAGWQYKNNQWQKQENYRTIRLKINLVVNSSNQTRMQVAQNIVEQLKNVGIQVTIVKASDDQYQKYLENKNYDMILTGKIISQNPDLTAYFGANNLANYSNEEINTVMRDISNITKDENLLKEKYRRLVEINNSEILYISLYNNKGTVIYSSNLMGNINPNFYNIFYNISSWYRQY